jgi:hypothetical protein
MRDTTYRVLIAIVAVYGTLGIPSLLHHAKLPEEPWAINHFFAPISMALLPIAVLGLWGVRLWGVYCLLIGLILALISLPPLSVFHDLILLFTGLRYYFARDDMPKTQPEN